MNPQVEVYLNQIYATYAEVCIKYVTEVGKLGSKHNGLTIQWMKKEPLAARTLKRQIRDLTKYSETYLDREEKLEVLREMYALKPGVHEAYYPEEHKGFVLGRAQSWVKKAGVRASLADATYLLKSLVVQENYDRTSSTLFDGPGEWGIPTNVEELQSITKFTLELTDWRSLDELKPMGSWWTYAPCAINEGPFLTKRDTGSDVYKHMFDMVEDASNLAEYKDIVPNFIREKND